MAHREKTPYKAQDPQEVKELIQTLEAHAKKGGKGKSTFSCRKSKFDLPNNRILEGWKMQEWDYKKEHLPTYARGLFTYKTHAGHQEIAVRGYDKFFNHGEVRKTEWENVKRNTRGPYELSVKENGCIIFISGLDDDSLLVCSKHSTGPRDDPNKSHAIWGERWIDRQLKVLNKTRGDLARTLRGMNATAVAELCDDAFEEHVLAYGPGDAGLYLHGINLNLPEFATYPGPLVDKFADEWGFRKVQYVMKDDIDEVKRFLDNVAETGNYNGRDTEGFVIRCQAREGRSDEWHDWFFKYKFEEPYLMYRQWRECTKAIITGHAPRYKKHKKITEQYLMYARRRFAKEPQLTKAYNQNHGIISLRDDFLNEIGLKGSDIIRQELEAGEESVSAAVTRNVVLIPVATIGCGKTTIAVALAKLFGWGHIQNDNIPGKGNRPQRFAIGTTNLMAEYPVTIADRNNHQKRERDQIIADITKVVPNAKFVALHWVHDEADYSAIRRAMQDRVLNRGDNHQTIQAASEPEKLIGIMDGFLRRFEPVDTENRPDNAFDLVIDLDVTANSRENLETVISKLHEEFPKLFPENMPSADDLDRAIDAALNEYKPDLKQDLSFGGSKKDRNKNNNPRDITSQPNTPSTSALSKAPKAPKLEFFAVRLPSDRIRTLLDTLFYSSDPPTARFYRQLTGSRRIQSEFHVTLLHRSVAASRDHKSTWNEYTAIHKRVYDRAVEKGEKIVSGAPGLEPQIGTCKVLLERVVWDGRVMCVVARLGDGTVVETGPGTTQAGAGAGDQTGVVQSTPFEWKTANAVAHITVGTASKDIKPKESNDLLQRWLHEGSGDSSGIRELLIPGSASGSGNATSAAGSKETGDEVVSAATEDSDMVDGTANGNGRKAKVGAVGERVLEGSVKGVLQRF